MCIWINQQNILPPNATHTRWLTFWIQTVWNWVLHSDIELHICWFLLITFNLYRINLLICHHFIVLCFNWCLQIWLDKFVSLIIICTRKTIRNAQYNTSINWYGVVSLWLRILTEKQRENKKDSLKVAHMHTAPHCTAHSQCIWHMQSALSEIVLRFRIDLNRFQSDTIVCVNMSNACGRFKQNGSQFFFFWEIANRFDWKFTYLFKSNQLFNPFSVWL